jgi:hypothetical protein
MNTIRGLARETNIRGLNLYTNPLSRQDGDLLRAVNVSGSIYGAKTKRPGYTTYLGTADGSKVNSLFSWYKDDGTTFFNYRASGSALYYSAQGTGDWTICANGTIGNNAHVSHAVLDDTLIICDGVGSTRHTTDGTAFTNTTLAPVMTSLEMYQNRIYGCGTASTLFYSTTNDATNWELSGTADSSSFNIPGAGKLSKVFKTDDKLIINKNSGLQYKWDGYALVDTASKLAPTSPYSVAETEGYYFWINRLGVFGYGGVRPQLLSNAIQPFIYNNAGGGIVGTAFEGIPATCYRYDYLAAIGTVTDDLTNETIKNAVLKYDYQKDEYTMYSFDDFPTAIHSFKDASGNDQLIWGDANGQCYKLGGTTTSDNGKTIEAVMEFVIDMRRPENDKEWRWLHAYFNPGNTCKVAIAWGDSYMKEGKNWQDIGDASSGLLEWRFPANARSRLLFIKIYEASKGPAFTFYGYSVEANIIDNP